MTPIKYIGKRPTYREGAYGSGIVFEAGQTIEVDDALATKLLRHKDVYVRGDVSESTGQNDSVSPKLDEVEDKTQEQRDAIMSMDKDAIEQFCKTNFRVDVDRRKSVDNLRQVAIGLIDQFGTE